MRAARLWASAFLPFLLSGCGLFQHQVITLCTNRAEVAAYVEYFNTLPSEYRVVLCYDADPAGRVVGRSRDADLVLGPWLNGGEARAQLDPVNRLFNKEYLDRGWFYGGLLDGGMVEGKQLALPFSFNLPAVVFPIGGFTGEVPNLAMPLEYLRDTGGRFNESVRERYVRMGFSPLWDPRFLYTAAGLFNAQFRESSDGGVLWNSARLQEMKSFCLSWVEETNGGYEQEERFVRKYLYEPMPKLLEDGRILFHVTDSSQLLEELQQPREEVDFRWLGSEEGIPVDEEVLYFGIPRASRNKRGARLFLSWIYQEQTQQKLLELNHEKRLSIFGLAGGFSALRAVSERQFPQFYRPLLGRIPPEELLRFPKPLPVRWSKLKTEVVVPWLIDYVLGRSDEQVLAHRIGEYQRAVSPGAP